MHCGFASPPVAEPSRVLFDPPTLSGVFVRFSDCRSLPSRFRELFRLSVRNFLHPAAYKSLSQARAPRDNLTKCSPAGDAQPASVSFHLIGPAQTHWVQLQFALWRWPSPLRWIFHIAGLSPTLLKQIASNRRGVSLDGFLFPVDNGRG